MATIDLHDVDELIQVREAQHGGNRGSPPVFGGHRVCVSLNRSCVVMLSALLQAHVEEVYKGAAKRKFPQLAARPEATASTSISLARKRIHFAKKLETKASKVLLPLDWS